MMWFDDRQFNLACNRVTALEAEINEARKHRDACEEGDLKNQWRDCMERIMDRLNGAREQVRCEQGRAMREHGCY